MAAKKKLVKDESTKSDPVGIKTQPKVEIKKLSLFDIQKQYLELMDGIMENEGELTLDMEKALEITEKNISVKADNYGGLIERMAAEEAFIANKIKELTAAKKVISNTHNRLKNNMLAAMSNMGYAKLDTENFKFSTRKSKQVKVECEAKELPSFAKKVEVTISPIAKAEMKKMIDEGTEIKGVVIVENISLTVKNK